MKKKLVAWAILSAGAALALFMPVDILDIDWLKAAVKQTANFIPMIKRLEVDFELTQVAQLYYSVMWLCLPVFFYSVDVGNGDDLINKFRSKSYFILWPVVFFGFIWFGLIFMLSYSSPDPFGRGILDAVMLRSRFGMATMGGVVMVSLAVLPKLIIHCIICIFRILKEGRK